MKTLDQIALITMDELEEIAGDKSVKAPETLAKDVEDAVRVAEFASEDIKSRRGLYAVAMPVVAAAAALAVVVTLRHNTPKDTFDDPALAYAELEKTFSYISTKMTAGVDMVREAEPAMTLSSDIINRLK